jgi:hypothetical protein
MFVALLSIMKIYTCSHCRNPLYFENNICLHCQHAVGFESLSLSMVTLEPDKNNTGCFTDISKGKKAYRYCKNAGYGTCNWLVPVADPSPFCTACRLNRVIPDLSTEENGKKWRNLEVAKHRLIYSLLRLKLPLSTKAEAIVFDFMEETARGEKVITGHDSGTITINIEEADEVQRVRHKLDLGERYRTLLGHFRHEVGHYYWDVLIRDDKYLDPFRRLFGDEQRDYAEALQTYYQTGPPADWGQHYISPYATAHPWEDWAETWAHYLHLMDTLETAWAFGVRVNPIKEKTDPPIKASMEDDPYEVKDFSRIIKLWYPLCFAVNSLNRSMGYPDFYPFVISEPVVEKLRFIHELCMQQA